MNEKTYCYEYPRPAVCTDCVIFSFDGKTLNVLLIERKHEPFQGKWAFPGGFLDMDETTHACAKRELEEETGLKNIEIEQLYTFSDIERDPRGRIISVVYFALVNTADYKPIAADDANKAQWFKIDEMPSLAFDHDLVLDVAIKKLKSKARFFPIGIDLFKNAFSLDELRALYEAILSLKIDNKTFQLKMLNSGLLIKENKNQELFIFDKDEYNELTKSGFDFGS